jgi:hypothetical protein
LPWKKKDEPYRLQTVEGELVEYGAGIIDTEVAQLPMNICGKIHYLTLDITEISTHDVILGIPWLRASNPRVNWRTGHLQWDIPGSGSVPEQRHGRRPCPSNEHEERALRIYIMTKELKATTAADIPGEYQRYAKLFQPELETGLPQHGKWDHEITLKPGAEPKFHPIYPLNETQLQALREYLDENLRKGYIRPSKSPAGYPILFVPKKNGKLRLCVDYRQLNDITIKNRYPLPLASELRDRLHGAQWFTTLDLKGAYNLIRIKEGDEWKTAFRTRLGHYEYLVMPFGLTNAPASFQVMINEVLREHLDIFVFAYLDDILIFSKTLEEHKRHVHQVLKKLEQANLLVETEKSEFHKQKVKFLAYEISPGTIAMDPDKVAAVREWPAPTNVRDVRAFLGFVNFYRRFIQGYSRIAIPLTNLTRKDLEFHWGTPEQKAFQELKDAILREPILATADPTRPYEVETDASDWALGGQLGQRDQEGRLHPVAFYSKKLNGPELNYPIHDKELMAIIEAFREWKPYLSGTTYQINVYTDHKNLTSFTTTKDLNKRQIRWYEFLSEFNFQILYKKGSENGRADALSRREDLKTETPPDNSALLSVNQKGNLELSTRALNLTWTVEPDTTWQKRIAQATSEDEWNQQDGTKGTPIERQGDTFQYHGRCYVPAALRRELVTTVHEHPLHGHQGVYKTLTRLRRSFDFPGSRSTVQEVIRNCDTCNRSKTGRHQPYGELQPIPVPEKAWETVAMDFITKLPKSKEPLTGTLYDSILVITDKLTKYAYFLPYKEESTAEDIAYTFIRVVISQHGVPKQLISDRDKLFTSKFWKALMKALGLNHTLSTAYHPQTDGQTERLNQTLEAYLRSYINYQQDNWVELLATAQMSYNNSPLESTGVSPCFANYGIEQPLAIYQGLSTNPAANHKAENMVTIQNEMRKELTFLQHRMKAYADSKRLRGPTLQEGDKVYLLRRNIKTKRPSDKLDWKKLGPFKIEKKISEVNYRLSLPRTMRIHPTFHVSLLEPAPANTKLQTQVEVDTEEYEVEKILDQRQGQQETEYFVKWKGYPHEENTWEPRSNLGSCQQALQQFLQTTQTVPTSGATGPSGKPGRSRPRGFRRTTRQKGDGPPPL